MKTSRKAKARLVASVVVILAFSGCTVGPDYARPESTPPGEFRNQIGPSTAESFADLPWWDVFNDPQLKALITEGLNNNLDLLRSDQIFEKRPKRPFVHAPTPSDASGDMP